LEVLLSLLLSFVLLVAAPAPSGHARDGSAQPPRLWIMQNMWGLVAVPTKEAEWPLEEKVARLKAAGFDGVDPHYVGSDPAAPARVRELVALARKHGLKMGSATSVNKIEDLAATMPLVKETGTPYLDVMVGSYWTPDADAVALLRASLEMCRREGVAMMAQTHRGLVTQDLIRTIGYTEAIPDLRFDLDLSHYIVAGEIGGRLSPEADRRFDIVMQRAAMMDGRVSNGEQVQVDMGPAADNAPARVFAGLRMRDLAERTWNEAVQETGVGQRHGGASASSR